MDRLHDELQMEMFEDDLETFEQNQVFQDALDDDDDAFYDALFEDD